MQANTVDVREEGWGNTIALGVDRDGDLEFAWTGDREEIYIKPAALVAALVELGILPADVDKSRVRQIEPSDRVREAWRQSALHDANERPTINHHAYRRRLKAEQAAQQAAKLAGPRYYRDADGDTWRTLADGRLVLCVMRSGQTVREFTNQPRTREFVEASYGGLTEVPGPTQRVSITSAQVQINPSRDAETLATVRDHIRRTMPHTSVWRDF